MNQSNERRSQDEPCRFLDAIRDLAHQAGQAIMAIYATDFDVTHKEDNSPLTRADMAAHRTITDGLRRLAPNVPILSEESVEIAFEERQQWERYWLIDPLDGTREFIKRNGEFTVNIALIDDHDAVAGVVHAPVTGVTYYACRGHGAFKHLPGEEPIPIHVRPLPDGPIVVAGSRSHKNDALDQFLKKVGRHRLVSMGSALKSCLVAEGTADIYPRLGPTSEWDTAAAQCVVEEAGGRVTTTDLTPLRYNTKDSLINPSFIVFGDATRDWSQYFT